MRDKKWPSDKVLSFPLDLQKEIMDEILVYDEDYFNYIETWSLKSESPVYISNKIMLETNIDVFDREPEYIINLLNKKCGTSVKSKKVVDVRPERIIEYSKLKPETAPPSVLVDGSLAFGNGRWLASLLRGDDGIYVWDIETSNRE
jgi:hypothetical protein